MKRGADHLVGNGRRSFFSSDFLSHEEQQRRELRDYLRHGSHGASDALFAKGSPRLYVEIVGRTNVGDTPGMMILRVAQNDQGSAKAIEVWR